MWMNESNKPSEPMPHTDAAGNIVEPGNATVSDWFGQETQRDEQTADEAMERAGGDEARAAEIFEQRRQPHRSAQYDVPSGDRTHAR